MVELNPSLTKAIDQYTSAIQRSTPSTLQMRIAMCVMSLLAVAARFTLCWEAKTQVCTCQGEWTRRPVYNPTQDPPPWAELAAVAILSLWIVYGICERYQNHVERERGSQAKALVLELKRAKVSEKIPALHRIAAKVGHGKYQKLARHYLNNAGLNPQW